MSGVEELREVVALVCGAEIVASIGVGRGGFSSVEEATEAEMVTAHEARVAAYEWVRTHAPALLERIAALEAESARLDWLLENHANVETDGSGNWRAVLEWTATETYFPYAKDSRAAIDAALDAARSL